MSAVRSFPMSDATVARLREVQRVILAHPKQFDMDKWKVEMPGSREAEDLDEKAECGTTCCIAGWFFLATPKGDREDEIPETLASALGVPASDYSLGPIIYAQQWPEPFQSNYFLASSSARRARVAAAYIDALIAARMPL